MIAAVRTSITYKTGIASIFINTVYVNFLCPEVLTDPLIFIVGLELVRKYISWLGDVNLHKFMQARVYSRTALKRIMSLISADKEGTLDNSHLH